MPKSDSRIRICIAATVTMIMKIPRWLSLEVLPPMTVVAGDRLADGKSKVFGQPSTNFISKFFTSLKRLLPWFVHYSRLRNHGHILLVTKRPSQILTPLLQNAYRTLYDSSLILIRFSLLSCHSRSRTWANSCRSVLTSVSDTSLSLLYIY